MGLDMYLSAKKYASGYDFLKADEREQFAQIIGAAGAEDLVDETTPSATVSVTIGYWRKANAIHKWFVNNCANGRDDCRGMHVSSDALNELKAECQKALAQKYSTIDDNVLPPSTGFFFGGQEMDEYYYDSLEHTLSIIAVAEKARNRGFEIEYQASW